MWNCFDQCRPFLAKPGSSCHQVGLSCTELKREIDEKIDAFLPISVSRAKSEAITAILNRAAIRIHPDEIFAVGLLHGGVMNDFSSRMRNTDTFHVIAKTAQFYEQTNTFRANTDFGHIAPDWTYVLSRGIPGILEDLEGSSAQHSGNSPQSVYYRERITVYKAILVCFERFASLATSMNSEKGRFIASNLRHLQKHPPQTLAQAMQLILLFYIIQTHLDTAIVRSLGSLDRMLAPFYRADRESGRFTDSQLAEITKYFLWEIACMKVTANLPFYIGGRTAEGIDASNEFTFFLLERYREMELYDPKIHVMYHEAMDPKLIRLLLTMIREGKNSFVFINTDIASRALINIGVAPEDAKKVIVYGCYETAAEGEEVPCTCAGMLNLAKSIEMFLASGRQPDTFEEFFEGVMRELEAYTDICMDTIAAYEPHYHELCPSMILSPTFKSSRESGVDLFSGGAKYNNTSIVGAGLATLCDSLIAIKKAVYEDKLRNLSELCAILDSNWEGEETLRLQIRKKYPKFGNNDDEADVIANRIADRLAARINSRHNGRGGVFRFGLFSVDWRHWMGAKTGATPDGRLAGEPLSKNLAASIGMDKSGVTAYLQSVLKIDGTKTPDGYVADVVLHHSAVQDEDGLRAFDSLLRTFMKSGGFSVHFNILSPETLKKALQEPEKYPNLQIRLCGWNVRFVDLDRAQQDEFIKQSENAM